FVHELLRHERGNVSTPARTRKSVDGEDDLAEGLPLLEETVRVGGAPEGHHAVDHRAQLALLDEAQDAEEIALRAHRRAEDLDLAEEHVTQIHLGREAGRRAARHDAAAPRRREDALREDLAADVLDDGVDAALVGETLALGDEVLLRVVD